jgi:hypothetical protein
MIRSVGAGGPVGIFRRRGVFVNDLGAGYAYDFLDNPPGGAETFIRAARRFL